MQQNKHMVSLGFISEKVSAGTHICLIYSKEEERLDSLLKFLLSGLESGERTICFSEKMDEDILRDFFQKNGISYDERKKNNAVTLSKAREVYFQDNKFDPERMLKNIERFYDESKAMNFKDCRIIGEMFPDVGYISGGDRLLEYESRVSILLRDRPVTTICQYNANDFDGAMIMDILKVHPQLIVNGSLVQNPLYIPPEDFIAMN